MVKYVLSYDDGFANAKIVPYSKNLKSHQNTLPHNEYAESIKKNPWSSPWRARRPWFTTWGSFICCCLDQALVFKTYYRQQTLIFYIDGYKKELNQEDIKIKLHAKESELIKINKIMDKHILKRAEYLV